MGTAERHYGFRGIQSEVTGPTNRINCILRLSENLQRPSESEKEGTMDTLEPSTINTQSIERGRESTGESMNNDSNQLCSQKNHRKRRLLSITELVFRLGVSRTKTYSLLNSGEIPSMKIGERTLVDESDFDAFIDKVKADARKPKADEKPPKRS
jgi:excisionase family DNA binding protein